MLIADCAVWLTFSPFMLTIFLFSIRLIYSRRSIPVGVWPFCWKVATLSLTLKQGTNKKTACFFYSSLFFVLSINCPILLLPLDVMIGEPSTSCSEFTAPITATLGFRHDESTYDISYAPTPAKAAVPPPANSSDKTAAILSEIVQVKGPDIKKTHSYKGQVCTMMDGLKSKE